MRLEMLGHADSCLCIDLGAIVANWRYIDSLSAPSTVTAAMVKANGYGLGAAAVAGALAAAGCGEFFVASLDEAIALRQHLDEVGHPEPHIMTLHGCHIGQEEAHAQHRITPVLNDLEQLTRWRLFSQKIAEKLPALLHFDTGMTRLGFDPDQTDWLIQNKAAYDGLVVRYIMSHLVSGEVIGAPITTQQLAAFNELRSWFAGVPASLANSAGSLLPTPYHFQMTRPGIALYGAHPADCPTDKLQPVVRWHARIMQLRRAKAGDRVGYGGTHLLTRESKIATIGVGYADGYDRQLGGKAIVQIGDKHAPVIGRVSMDSTTVDVTDLADGDLVSGTADLLHAGYDVPRMAADANTISYEVLTRLGARPARHYLKP